VFPILHEYFIIDVYEARALSADCILLIVAALNDAQLRNLADLSNTFRHRWTC